MKKINFKRAALAAALLAPVFAWSQVSLSVTVAPPPLPVYAQPPVPGDGYIWTPGYWSWDPSVGDYEWVPGTWVLPPQVGFLWTPGYWAFLNGGYFWHRGYWGDHVGYYGGLNYGYGYGGHGYYGGRWDQGHFHYNQAYNNVPHGRVHDVYNQPMRGRGLDSHDSFNGHGSAFHGQPSRAESHYQDAPHGGPTQEQMDHEHRAMSTPEQRMSNNHGAPPTAATPRAGGFGQPGVEHVRSAPQVQPAREVGGGRPQGFSRPEGGGGNPQGGGRPEGGGGRPAGGERPGGGGERPGGGEHGHDSH